MIIHRDQKGQPYVEWQIGPGGFKRAWVQTRHDPSKDWAGTRRYLNVVRIDELGAGPGGNATDFPIFSELPDEQVLVAFVHAVSAITGCRLSPSRVEAT